MLDFGVFLGFPVPLFAPCGTALVQDNKIKVGEYFEYQGTTNSAGVLVNLWNSMPSRSVRAIVSRNTIDMVHSSPPADPNANFAGGVLLMDMEPNGSANVTTVIDHNVISGGAAVPARWGIGLRGSAHDLLVRENDTRSFTAAQAQMFIETTAHDGIYSGNVLGPVQPAIPGISPLAVLFCDGDNNRFFDNDFSMSNAPGWDNGGFGYVKLAEKSDHNVLVAPHLNTGQYLDAGVSHTNHLFAV